MGSARLSISDHGEWLYISRELQYEKHLHEGINSTTQTGGQACFLTCHTENDIDHTRPVIPTVYCKQMNRTTVQMNSNEEEMCRKAPSHSCA